MPDQKLSTTDEKHYAGGEFKFYARQDYFKELAKQIAATVRGDRVVLTSMTLDSKEPQIRQIMVELSVAAKRGVKTSLAVDAYTFMTDGKFKPGPLLLYRKLPKRMPDYYAANLEALEAFRQAGGNYSIINRPRRPFTQPFAGRCHIKLAIINNRVYLGGCNLMGSDQIDMMVGWDDKPVADRLYGMTEHIINTGNSRLALDGKDLSIRVSEDAELFIDSGVPKQSIIMSKALEFIDQAQESIFFACQFFPNSTTIKHLRQAHRRGVKVTILYNHPSQHSIPRNVLHHLVLISERTHTPPSLMKDQVNKNLPYLHGKLIATEQGAMMGSHNYVMAGVNFGTTEIALLKYDANFAKQAIATLTDQLD